MLQLLNVALFLYGPVQDGGNQAKHCTGNPDRIVIAEYFVEHTGLARQGVRPNQGTSVCEYAVIQ